MQTYLKKFIKIFFIYLAYLSQPTDSQAQTTLHKKADSLYKEKNFEQAYIIYQKIFENNSNINPNIFLKLAYISEQKGEFVNELFYLNKYLFQKPSESIFEKMYVIATENGFSGYEKNDLNYILFYYRQYANYIWGTLILLGIYIFVVLIMKKNRGQFSPLRHKIVFVIYLIFLAGLINLPNNYRSAIIKNEKVYLRDYPSAASQIIGSITEGNRLNIIKSDDIWFQVLWEGKFCYIKSTDILVVK